MRFLSVFCLSGLLAISLLSGPALAAPPACEKNADEVLPRPAIRYSVEDDLPEFRFFKKEPPLKAHFTLLPIVYPYNGLKMYGFSLSMIVSEEGRVACATIEPPYRAQDPVMNDRRHAFLEEVANWRFDPYIYEGKPSRVAIELRIDEEEQPRQHRPAPKGDPRKLVIVQENRPWFASYRPYRVELRGDGSAVYRSLRKTDPLGPQAYTLDADEVQALLKTAEAADFWSLRDKYRQSPNALKNASSSLSLSILFGGRRKSVQDYFNEDSGKPRALEALHQQVMQTANLDFWEIPSLRTLDQLDTNGFDFRSFQAGQFLIETAANHRVEDDVVLSIMDRGAPLDYILYDADADSARPLLEVSLATGRESVARRLIEAGALKTDGEIDRQKVNQAFLGSIESGYVELVEMILVYKPDMVQTHPYDPDLSTPAVVYIGRSNAEDEDKIAVLKLLLARGADINARDSYGETLLHGVALSPAFVHFLIDNGADVNAVADNGGTPLNMAFLEEVTLLMLEKGADPRLSDNAEHLRSNVKRNGWLKVGRWLTEHGYADVLITPPGETD